MTLDSMKKKFLAVLALVLVAAGTSYALAAGWGPKGIASTIAAAAPALKASVAPEPDAAMLVFAGLACLWIGEVRRAGGSRFF